MPVMCGKKQRNKQLWMCFTFLSLSHRNSFFFAMPVTTIVSGGIQGMLGVFLELVLASHHLGSYGAADVCFR